VFDTREYPSPLATDEDAVTRTTDLLLIDHTDGRPAGEAASGVIPAMGLPNRAPGVAVMGGSDRYPRLDVMGVPDGGLGLDVMGGPHRGPRLDVMGESDPRFVDFVFTGRSH
jgi:hypothetical protein